MSDSRKAAADMIETEKALENQIRNDTSLTELIELINHTAGVMNSARLTKESHDQLQQQINALKGIIAKETGIRNESAINTVVNRLKVG